MIPEPSLSLLQIILFPVLGIIIISMAFAMHKDKSSYFIIGVIITILIICITVYYDYLEGEKYQKLLDKHNNEIEKIILTSDCNVLPELYNQEYYKNFKEKIKSKYIFDCVAEKEQLELLK